jgi:hypothetical protein
MSYQSGTLHATRGADLATVDYSLHTLLYQFNFIIGEFSLSLLEEETIAYPRAPVTSVLI